MMKPKRGLNILICGAMMLSFSPQAILAKDITQNEQSPTSSLFQEESHLVESVQQQINDLPTFQRLQNMTKEEQQEVYNKLQVAHEAYAALIDEQKKQITGAEIFDSLFEVFNNMTALAADGTHDISTGSLTISEDGDYTVTGSTTSNNIVINSGVTATITLSGASIDLSSIQDDRARKSAIKISENANVTLTLAEGTENKLISSSELPGIHLPDGACLTINGTGSLNVTGGSGITSHGGTGIGGCLYSQSDGTYAAESCGTVIILNGNITIRGGDAEANCGGTGIGGANGNGPSVGGNGGTVIILGGTVDVKGGNQGKDSVGNDIGGGKGPPGQDGDDGQGIKPTGEANTYEVWGELTLPEGVTIPEGAILTGSGSFAEGSKITQDAPTSAPTASQITDTSVTLNTVTGGKTQVRYVCVQGASAAPPTTDGQWDPQLTIPDLMAATAYTFYAQYCESKFYQASPASPGLTVITAPHTSTVSINYKTERITFAENTFEVSSDSNFSNFFQTNGSISGCHALYMRAKVEDGTQAPIRGVTTVSIPPRPNHADSITVVNASAAGVNDGKITGVSCDMEYREENITTWTDCAGDTVENLAPGTYYVRTKATENSFASVSAEVTIGVGNIITIELPTFDSVYFGYPTPDPKPIKIHNSSGEEVTITGVSCTGEAFNLRAEANPNIFKVPAGGTNSYYSLQPNPGLYPREYASTITVTYRDTNDNSYAVTATARFAVLPQPTDEDTNIVGGGGSSVQLNPVYRAYNPNNGEHLYTLDETEYKHVTSNGWDAEGIAFMAETEKNGQALYRVYNPNSGLHHYTLDENEKNTLVSLGWHDEKVAWYTSKKTQSAPVYRVYNPNDGNHHYTMNQQEKDVLVSLGWQFEGIAFRTVPIETK